MARVLLPRFIRSALSVGGRPLTSTWLLLQTSQLGEVVASSNCPPPVPGRSRTALSVRRHCGHSAPMTAYTGIYLPHTCPIPGSPNSGEQSAFDERRWTLSTLASTGSRSTRYTVHQQVLVLSKNAVPQLLVKPTSRRMPHEASDVSILARLGVAASVSLREQLEWCLH